MTGSSCSRLIGKGEPQTGIRKKIHFLDPIGGRATIPSYEVAANRRFPEWESRWRRHTRKGSDELRAA